MPETESSIPALLERRAQQQPDEIAYTFFDYESDPAGVSESLTWSELYERVQVVAEHVGKHGSPGDRAVILAPQSLEYVIGFFGVIQAGLIAVPLSMPAPGQADERVACVLSDCSPVAVLTTSAVVDDLRTYVHAQDGRPARMIEIDALDFYSDVKPAVGQPLTPRPVTKVAYLQYTSGSTRAPRGVELTHANVIANLDQMRIDYFGGEAPEDLTVVSWLPFYHDMGLIVGLFVAATWGANAVLMTPVAFAQSPARWIRHLARNGQTFCAAPNFAYDLSVRRVTDEDMDGLDLGGVTVMMNGAERVHASTVRRFNERFGAFGLSESAHRPSYGLAEATVFVVASDPDRPPTVVRFDADKLAAGHAELCDAGGSEQVSCGTPRSSDVRIVDPQTMLEKPAGQVGEIWVHGAQISTGYWRNPELSRQVFHAEVAEPSAGTPRGPWLRTGDLGVLVDGELFIVGRIKDLLIIDGRNHYPDDIEATVAQFITGRMAAISVDTDTSEELVVLAEFKSDDAQAHEALKTRITAAVSQQHGVRLADLMLVGSGSLPVTTSGKVRRSTCAQRYRSGQFTRLGAP
ncbi:MAG: fatty-acid--AMP ligase [Mycobacterium sp.]|nr:fatty-acid--AMP ligase [Mycobacterium sp.]